MHVLASSVSMSEVDVGPFRLLSAGIKRYLLLVSRSPVESFCDGCVVLAKEFSTAF